MTSWKITGIIATLVIIVSLPLYVWKEEHGRKPTTMVDGPFEALFVGSPKCQSCHRKEYDKWEQSHHRWAMAVADEHSVRGDFNNATFEHIGIASRFYQRNGKYLVYTQGPQGQMGEFEITHTFGWYPLQQYLVPFDGGRLQCLPLAWDVRQKRWYHLNPDRQLDPQDWLYWTNNGQNWNGMCAECHSTDLKKNYDLYADTYQTTWSEISVGCEACHGPGSEHVKWAELPDMARPEVDNFALSVQTRGLSSRQQIELCAPCHARRMSLDDNIHKHADFLDYGIPQLLSEGMYFADGQILEEVYVYGSFMQSKMYARDVRCSDCHDVHSIQRIQPGNALCLQCHREAVYDTRDHHFHKQKGEPGEPIKSKSGEILFEVGSGAQCEQCHMPGRLYMGIDYRPDHSFRIPRPDLSAAIDVPNACNRCHIDQTNLWSIDTMAKWYGPHQRPHYGNLIAAGRERRPEALSGLIRLTDDRLYPAIVRATALALLATHDQDQSRLALRRAMADEEALVRHYAVRHLAEPEPATQVKLLAPLLYDPVRAVRIEAARSLAALPKNLLPKGIHEPFQLALDDYVHVMERTADFATSRHNLGNLYTDLGQDARAIDHYRKAIEIDAEFYPSKVNLAILYSRQGNNNEAERLLREALDARADLYEVHYSLGLLLAEEKQYEQAAHHLEVAAENMPGHARVHYNYGQLMAYFQKDRRAQKAFERAYAIDPSNPDYFQALARYYLQRNKIQAARQMAEEALVRDPANRMANELLTVVKQRTATNMP